MFITGTIYIIDEAHLDVLKANLSNMPPPNSNYNPSVTALCIDMDETDNMLEMWFPEHSQKATILCPPPIAICKELDGDSEGFIEEYNNYLDYDSTVQDFISGMLMYLHIGGNILMYTPTNLSDEPIWTNTLLLYFLTRFGITIGTSESAPFVYDYRYDSQIADILYIRNYIGLFEYINLADPNIRSVEVAQKLSTELSPYAGKDTDPLTLFYQARVDSLMNNSSILKPAIIFEG